MSTATEPTLTCKFCSSITDVKDGELVWNDEKWQCQHCDSWNHHKAGDPLLTQYDEPWFSVRVFMEMTYSVQAKDAEAAEHEVQRELPSEAIVHSMDVTPED